MVLERSLAAISQLRPNVALEHSPASVRLDDALKNYLLTRYAEDYSVKTLNTYQQRLFSFISFVSQGSEAPAIFWITNQHVRLFLASLRERNINSSTANAYHRAISAFFNWLIAEGLIGEGASPMRNVKAPRFRELEAKPFTREHITRMLLLCSGNRFLDIRDRAIILIFLDTGLRLFEMANIQLDDVDFKGGLISVKGKGKKERTVRLGQESHKALLRYRLLRNENCPQLWLTEERRPLAVRGLQIFIKRLCHRAGITGVKIGPHTFRHAAAINYLRNGGGEFTLQIMLGHSTLKMTRRYVSSLGAEDMIEAHKKASPVDNMFPKK